MDALKAGGLSCLPGADGYADTKPAVNIASEKVYHGSNMLYLKEHQKEHGFPTAEYITASQIDNANRDNPSVALKKGEKGVTLRTSEFNDETGEWENKTFTLYNVEQTTNSNALKNWVKEKREEKEERIASQFSESYKPGETKERGSGPEIICTSTEPEKYLGQYLAAVSLGGRFKASGEQAAGFSKKLEDSLYVKMDNGHTNPFKLSKISNEASQYCKEVIKEVRMDALRQSREQKKEMEQSRGRGM